MALLGLIILASLVYLVGLAVYRLYFSPAAKFPGPRLGALSTWYEAYYDVYLRGRFTYQFDKLHEQYGPIVRIGPNEVHIKDPEFWDEVYVRRPKADKPIAVAHRFGNPESGFGMVDAAHHRALRAPLNPFFSRRALLEQQDQIQAKAETFCEGFKRTTKPVNLLEAYSTFTSDVVYDFAFGFSYNQVESEDFKFNFSEQFAAVVEFGPIVVQWPWVNTVLENYLPQFVLDKVPLLKNMALLRADILRTVQRERRAFEKKEALGSGERTMFQAVLESDLPASDKRDFRLQQEAQAIIGGGVLTSAWSLAHASYHILSNPEVLATLQKELREAIPDVSQTGAFSYEKLERIPYLTGCVKEGIRLSDPVSGRLGRVFHEPLAYKDWEIPPGTTVSMNARDVSFDEKIFEDPKRFKPERWGTNVTKFEDSSSLEKNFVPFSKGPRMCLGMPLAYMEAHIILAQVFRRMDLKLFETGPRDIEFAHDWFIPGAHSDSHGIRVLVVH